MSTKNRKPRAYVADIQSDLPIHVVIWQRTQSCGQATERALTLPDAKKLSLDLTAAITRIDDYFQCAHTRPWICDPDHPIRCSSRGAVRVGSKYYCRVHARKAAEKAKVLP